MANGHEEMTSFYNSTTVPLPLDTVYASIEIITALAAIVGNILVLIVFFKFDSLKTVKNYYIISLSVADLLVGVIGIPCALATAVGLPPNFHACLFMNSLLLLLCTSSIFSLVAITLDRFWAIMYPLSYPAKATHRKVIGVIVVCWVLAGIVGLLPIMGWNNGRPIKPQCFFMEVIDRKYLAFLFFATILTPSLFMAAVYAAIYQEIKRQIRRLSCTFISNELECRKSIKSQSRAARGVAVIVLLFVVSWMPLYILNTLVCFCSSCTKNIPVELFNFCIVLSHLNSAWNPMLYAWGMRDFRLAVAKLFKLKGKAFQQSGSAL